MAYSTLFNRLSNLQPRVIDVSKESQGASSSESGSFVVSNNESEGANTSVHSSTGPNRSASLPPSTFNSQTSNPYTLASRIRRQNPKNLEREKALAKLRRERAKRQENSLTYQQLIAFREEQDMLKNQLEEEERQEKLAKMKALQNLYYELATEKIQNLRDHLERYAFNKNFLAPVIEKPNLYRRKRLCRYRYHIEDKLEPQVGTFLLQKYFKALRKHFIEGDYPNCFSLEDLPSVANDEVDHEVSNDLNEDEIRLENTMAYFCIKNKCPDLTDEALIYFEKVLKEFLDTLRLKEYEQAANTIFVTNPNLPGKNLKTFLFIYRDCYVGLRTIYNRVLLINNCLRVVNENDSMDYDRLPKILQKCVLKSMDRVETPAGLTEQSILKKYAKEMKDFEANENDLETNTCEMCQRYTRLSALASIKVTFDPKWLPSSIEHRSDVTVCVYCRRSLSSNKLPTFAYKNGLQLCEIPRCLKRLNFLGKAIIQTEKEILGSYPVTNQGGNFTGMIGKSGVLTVHKNPIKETLLYLAQTFSSSDPCIHVDSAVGNFRGEDVNVLDVIKALFFLKHLKNKHYRDINPSDFFILRDGKCFVNPRVHGEETPSQSLLVLTGSFMERMQCYALKENVYKPVTLSDIDQIFPELFPDGKYSLNFSRPIPLKATQFFCHCLRRGDDARFRESSSFLRVAVGYIEQNQASSCMGISSRQSSFKNLKVGDLMRMLASRSLNDQILVSSIFSSIRGSTAYWMGVKNRLKTFVKVFGPPNIFITLNPAILEWKALHRAYTNVAGEIVDETNIYQAVAKDPIIFTRFFHGRVRAVWKFLQSQNGPFGKIIQFFRRIEYQKGGLQHVHCFLWIKDAPTKKSCVEEIVKFIDKCTTCRMPDALTEPALHRIVNTCQRHETPCRNTCDQTFIQNGQLCQRCRFGFPFPKVAKTILTSSFPDLYPSHSRYPYLLARSEEERNINPYNAALALMWNGNTDVQILLDGISTVVDYVTHYVGKASTQYHKSMYRESYGQNVELSALFKIATNMMKGKRTSPTEACDIITGESLYQFSASTIYINCNAEDDRKRMALPYKQLKELAEDARAISENFEDDYYPKRPAQFSNVSLFNLKITFGIEYYSRTESGEQNLQEPARFSRGLDHYSNIELDNSVVDDSYPKGTFYHSGYSVNNPLSIFFDHRNVFKGQIFNLQNSQKQIVKLSRQYVPIVYFPNYKPGDVQGREDYFRRCCFLFIPWRDEKMIKNTDIDTYEAVWNAYMDDLKSTVLGEEAYRDIQRYLAQINAYYQTETSVMSQRNLGTAKSGAPKTMKTMNFDRGETDRKSLYEKIKQLSPEQNEIFKYFMNVVDNEVQETRFFLSGPAGAGKTHCLKVIDEAVTFKYCSSVEERTETPSVIICAATGCAATKLKGFTLHKLLRINEERFFPLTNNSLQMLQYHFCQCRLLIIDEISMISNELLAMIFERLFEILSQQNPEILQTKVLFSGDLMQLAPPFFSSVKQKHSNFCFEDLSQFFVKHFYGTYTSFNLWNALNPRYMELTGNERQKNDPEFFDILSRIRIQQHRKEDLIFLEQRALIKYPLGVDRDIHAVQYFHSLVQADQTAIALFATNDLVDRFNNAFFDFCFEAHEKVGIPVIVLDISENHMDSGDSENSDKDVLKECKPKQARPWQKRENKLNYRNPSKSTKMFLHRTSYATQLNLCIGARVMLTKNLHVDNGLVNGSIGTVVAFEYEEDGVNKNVYAVKVKFDNTCRVDTIYRQVFKYKQAYKSLKAIKYFPLKLAFAVTIHKAQGSSFTTILVSFRNVFAKAQAYVAISRVATLSGLHLLDFDANVFQCNEFALQEQNRLRASVHLPPYPMPSNGNTLHEMIDDDDDVQHDFKSSEEEESSQESEDETHGIINSTIEMFEAL